MKTAIALLLIYAVWAAETESAPKTAFVINGLGETLSLINLEDGTVDNNVVTLGLVPNWATISDGMLYVVNSISDDIYIIDIETNLIVDSILLPEGSNPWTIEFLNDSIAYVSAFLMNSVFSIDVKNRVILDTIPVGLSPQGLYITGNKIFVAITAFDPATWTWGDGMVYVIDAGTNSVIDSTAVGTNPQSLAMDTDGELYVVCTGDWGAIEGMVYRINSGTHEVLDSIRTGGTPVSISISSSGIAWVGAGGWVDNGYVYLIDTNTDSVLRGSDNPILVGRGVMGLAYDGGGNCYVSSFASDKVYKVDKMGNVLVSFSVGDGPSAIAIYTPPQGVEEENYELRIKNYELSVYPNPFREKTVIGYQLSVIGNQPITDYLSPITISIYDLTGRLVRTLPITDHRSPITVTWDGSDNQGRMVRGGVYFVRVHQLTKKVVVVR